MDFAIQRGFLYFSKLIFLLLLLTCTLIAPPLTHTLELSENEFKAAYLFNFARFTKWPDGSFDKVATPFHFCIVNNAAVANALKDAITSSNKRDQISVASLQAHDEFNKCRVVYLGTSTTSLPQTKLTSLAQASVLVVSESAEVGVIQFVLQNAKVKFIVNLDRAKESHLSLSAQLLKVALTTIETSGQQGSWNDLRVGVIG